MTGFDKNAKSSTFPSEFADASTKKTDSYGIDYAKAIWGSYTKNGQTLLLRKQRDIINRKYAEGLESIEKYKDRLDLKGDTSYLNLDFSPVNRIAKVVDDIVGNLMKVDYKLQCNAIDPASKLKQDEDRKEMYANMLLKKEAPDLQQVTGIPVVPPNAYVPDDDEEAELHFSLNYKQAVSIAMEEALNFVFSNNDFAESRRRILKDLVVLKKAAFQYYYDKEYNIKAEYVDPVDLITPYSKYDDFRNVPYIAVIKQFTIREIALMTDKFTEEELYKIAQTQAGKNNNPIWNSQWGMTYSGYYQQNPGIGYRPYDDFNISVLDFYYLTTNYEKYLSKEAQDGYTIKFGKQKDNFRIPKDSKWNYNTIEKKIQYRYEGKWIIGTDYIFDYKMSENIEREQVKGSYSPKCELPFVVIYPDIYDMENKSLVERMIPHEDQINLIHLKVQQFLIKAAPPGSDIDISGLEDVVAAMGDSTMKPIDIMKIKNQTGNLLFSSVRADGSTINGKPVERNENGLGGSFEQFIAAYNHEIQLMKDVVIESIQADPDTLVGTNKLILQSINTTLRPLFSSYVKVIEKAAKRISLMVQDSFQFGNKGFIDAIGLYSAKALEVGDKIPLAQFGINIELLPDDEEKAILTGDIQRGLDTGIITVADAAIVRQIMKQNPKLATQMLIYREKKNRESKQKESLQLQQQNGDIQVQSAQAAKQAEVEADTATTQNEAILINLEWDRKERYQKIVAQDNLELQDKKNQGAVHVAEKTHDGKLGLEAFKNATERTEVTP